MIYHQLDLDPIRNLVSEQLTLARKSNVIHGLFELDITLLLEKINQHRVNGHLFSYSTYLMFVLAHCLHDHPEMMDMRLGNKRRIRFSQVDLLTIIERPVKGRPSIPMALIIRDCGRKPLDEITAEVRNAKKAPPLSVEGVKERRQLLRLPGFLRRWTLSRIHKDPRKFVKYYGNVGFSSLHFFSDNRVWFGIPLSASPFCLVPAGTYKKVVKRNDQFEERDFGSFTFTVNHDLTDGAPTVRFTRDFAAKVESAFGL